MEAWRGCISLRKDTLSKGVTSTRLQSMVDRENQIPQFLREARSSSNSVDWLQTSLISFLTQDPHRVSPQFLPSCVGAYFPPTEPAVTHWMWQKGTCVRSESELKWPWGQAWASLRRMETMCSGAMSSQPGLPRPDQLQQATSSSGKRESPAQNSRTNPQPVD